MWIKWHFYQWAFAVQQTTIQLQWYPTINIYFSHVCRVWHFLNFFFSFLNWFQRERKGGRKTSMWNRNIDLLPLAHTLTEGWTHNPGMWPEQESNPQPFGSQDNAKPTEPHQPRQVQLFWVRWNWLRLSRWPETCVRGFPGLYSRERLAGVAQAVPCVGHSSIGRRASPRVQSLSNLCLHPMS